MAFELQTPKERLRFFNVRDYPNVTAVRSAIQGYSSSKLSEPQMYSRAQYIKNIGNANYDQVEIDKYYPLNMVPVDTEASLRKLDQGQLFKSMQNTYSTGPRIQPRTFGGYEPLPFGQFYPDPQSMDPKQKIF